MNISGLSRTLRQAMASSLWLLIDPHTPNTHTAYQLVQSNYHQGLEGGIKLHNLEGIKLRLNTTISHIRPSVHSVALIYTLVQYQQNYKHETGESPFIEISTNKSFPHIWLK